MNRRQFIKKSSVASLGIAAGMGLYTWQVEPFWLEFVRRKMAIKNLPDKLIGKTLMQISDVHVGNRFDYQYLIDSFQSAMKYSPDIVVYTGDYVNYENEQQFGQLQEVFRHAVQGKLATVGILGNHDYGRNWAEQSVAKEITGILEESGIKVLSNAQANVDGLQIIGLDDYWGKNFKPAQALAEFDKSRANIALCHNPDVCDLDVWNQYDSWILSGHTHGGQCKPPFLPPPMLPVKNKRYSAGEIDLQDGRTLYINRAIGHLHQVRFNVRPEITIFELARASV